MSGLLPGGTSTLHPAGPEHQACVSNRGKALKVEVCVDMYPRSFILFHCWIFAVKMVFRV